MSAAVIGRDEELDSVRAFLERVVRRPSALVLSGEPGIGKTILWEVGVDDARKRFHYVLSHRAVETESMLSFAALSDLLVDVSEEALPLLTAPRRRALEVALLLEEPEKDGPDPRAIALAFFDVVRALAASGPVLIAVDDLQWLDAPSAGLLHFALRRLRDERVGLLATVRIAPDASAPLEFERALPEEALERLSLGPLTLGALHHLVKARLGLTLTRPELVRLHEVTAGNPFFVLELGRELVHAEARLAPGQPLPVPSNLRKLLGERLARLPVETRTVLLSAAALARPTAGVLQAAHGDAADVPAALERAARAGVLEVEGPTVRFAHPLLASVCYEEAPIWRRQATHGLLATAVMDIEERARHLALAADGPNAGIASTVDTAADHAAARGASATAAALSELAAGITPPEFADEHRRRSLRAADLHRLAGDRERAGTILEDLRARVRSGVERAKVLFALASLRRSDLRTTALLCEEALVEAAGDDALSAEILAFLSWMRLLGGDVRGALADARSGLENAERVGDAVLVARAIARVSMAETWACEITPGVVERGVAIEERLAQPLEFHESPTVALARRLVCLSELDRARPLLEQAEAKAAANGDEGTRTHVLFHLALLEWFAGRWERALDHADAGLELAEQLGDEQLRGMILNVRATVDACLGHVDRARAEAEEALAISEAVSDAVFPVWDLAALGHLELSLGDLRAAECYLRPLPARLASLGWDDPTDQLWPDTIETLIGLDELKEAHSRLEQFEERAHRLRSPWALATAARCRALLAAAEGDLEGAFEAFELALAEHERAESPFERGRTLLALGSVHRRAKQKRAAREALQGALAVFGELDARLWADKARGELARVSGRRPSPQGLTETEERVAALAGQGLSNKEIAATLFVTVHTVEAHLVRVYRKLSIRSRGELAHRLAERVEAKL
jgi:DNA-binding CsgD family transcriptional regulator